MANQTNPGQHKDTVEVYHKGDKKKGIEGTGKKREMGTIQFENWGKKKGWALVPETEKSKSETATTSDAGNKEEDKSAEKTGENSSATENVIDMTSKDAIAYIKKLGSADKLDEIRAFIEPETTRDEADKRSTVLDAADKFLNA